MSAALHRERCTLVIVGLQDRGFRALDEATRRSLLDAVSMLKGTAARVDVPTVVTEIDPRSHGRPLPQLSGLRSVEHRRLSAMPDLQPHLGDRRQVVIAGLEAHLAVAQTAADLVDAGFEPWIVVEAVASQSRPQAEVALQRLARDGVRLTTLEACVFAWVPDVTDMLHHELWRTLR